MVGEAPAKHEVAEGRPFVGPSGKIQWPLLRLQTGLRREQLYVTNLSKTQFTEQQEKRGLSEEEYQLWGTLLDGELHNRRVIVAMGRHAARWLLGDPDARMEQVHGIPVFSHKYNAWVLPAFHTAAALRDGARLAFTNDDFKALARLLDGDIPKRAWPTARDYQDATMADIEELAAHIGFDGPGDVGLDTEYDGDEPLMFTWSISAGHGRLVHAHETELIAAFARAIAGKRVWLHNALADLLPLKKMGIDLYALGCDVRDTMILAGHQQTEPQGLKPLAWRHLGANVTEFEKLVAPYFDQQLVSYLIAARQLTEPARFERWGKPRKDGTRKRLLDGVENMSPLHRRLRLFTIDFDKGRVRDVNKRWNDWDEEDQAEVAEVVGKPPTFSLKGVPKEVYRPYACADPDYTLGIAHAPALQAYSSRILQQDNGRLPLLAEMQERGMLVDLAARDVLQAKLEAEREGLLTLLRAATDRPDFNPASPDHLAEALFGLVKTGVPGVYEFLKDKEYANVPAKGWTKTGAPKTDKKALGTLRGELDPDNELAVIPGLALEYKEVEKLLNTYVRPLHRFLDKDLVIHPNIRHTRVPSGRVSMVRPNMMAIPAKTALGMMVRALFKARPGYRLISLDHSQIELRLAAEVSQDPVMLQAFFDGVDLHRLTASKITGRAYTDEEFWGSKAGKLLRALFKQINFGILYGATAERIYLELLALGIRDFSLEQVQEFHAAWFELYAGVRRKIEQTARFMAQNGYAEDMWGRRRKLPGAHLYGKFWPMSALREEAIRQGFNLEIQGGANGLITNAMIRVRQEVMPTVRAAGYEIYPLLLIHDELILEVTDDDEAAGMTQLMGHAAMVADQPMFTVPLEAGMAQGYAWSDLK